MKNDLPTAVYERGMNHNYMVLGKCDFFGAANEGGRNYRVRMLLENSIQGLVPVTQRQINGEIKYYYEINSMQPLSRLMEKSALKYRELKALFLGCINIFDRLEEYLLDGRQIIIKPDFIYVNVENMEPHFVCYPDYEGDARLSFVEFVDELLTRIDHTDEQAVMLGYQVYRYTRNPNYVISGIKKFMESASAEISKAADAGFKDVKTEMDFTGGVLGKDISAGNVFAYDALPEKAKNAPLKRREDDSFYIAPDIADSAADEVIAPNKNTGSKYLVGGILGLSASALAGGVIAGARFLKLIKLSADIELYICGAAVASLAAAVLCFACYIKEVRQKKEIEALNDAEYDNSNAPELKEDDIYREIMGKEFANTLTSQAAASRDMPSSSETICLGNEAPQERILKGRVCGKEVNVPLSKLPLTIGKLEGMSDFVINDASVSKMHARFEERDGKVYVCDLNSTNGTVRNGETIKINTPVALEPGDTLRFGRSCFTYL